MKTNKTKVAAPTIKKASEWATLIDKCNNWEEIADILDAYIEETVSLANFRKNGVSTVRDQRHRWRAIFSLTKKPMDIEVFNSILEDTVPSLFQLCPGPTTLLYWQTIVDYTKPSDQ